MSYARATVGPDHLSGAPCIRNLRIPVAAIRSWGHVLCGRGRTGAWASTRCL